MGGAKTVEKQDITVTPQTTPEQEELIALQLNLAQQAAPLQEQTIQLQSDIVGAILSGEDLPGELGGLLSGIDEQQAQEIAQKGIEALPSFFQSSGLLDSGVAAEITSKAASDILLGIDQFNLANKASLLSLALGMGTTFQQPILTTTGQLGSTFQGLQPISTVGSTTTIAPNPFLTSFQTSLGNTLGETIGSGGTSAIGGLFKSSSPSPSPAPAPTTTIV